MKLTKEMIKAKAFDVIARNIVECDKEEIKNCHNFIDGVCCMALETIFLIGDEVQEDEKN